jgi:hypothetical protein
MAIKKDKTLNAKRDRDGSRSENTLQGGSGAGEGLIAVWVAKFTFGVKNAN